MINASQEFKALLKKGAKLVNYADITLKDGTVLNLGPSDFSVGGFSMSDKTTNGKFEIGTAIAKNISVTIANHTNKFSAYDFYKSIIYMYVAIEKEDGTVLKERKGKYYVINPTTPSDTIRLSGVDSMYLFDKPYNASTAFPATLQTILSDCCLDCGVNIGFEEFDNWNFVVMNKPEDCTYRQVVSWVAQIAGCHARINNDDYLELVWYDTSSFEKVNIDGGNYFVYENDNIIDGGDFTTYESDLIIDGGSFTDYSPPNITKVKPPTVSTDNVIITGVKVEYNKKEVLLGTEDYIISVKDNPFVADKENEVCQYLSDRLIGLSFRPLSCQMVNNPLFEPFDSCYVYDRKGNAYFTLINDVTYTISGFTTISCKAEDPVRNESSYVSESAKAIAQAKRNTEKQLTTYDKSVQNMNALASNAMGLYRESETQSDGSIIYYMSNRPITKNDNGVCSFETNSVVYKMTGDGFFVSEDGGMSYTSGFDSEGNAVVNVLSAIGITFDWARGGTLSLGGYDNLNGEIRIGNEEGETVGLINNNGIAIFSPTTKLQILISPNVGFVMRDADGNEFFGLSYDKTIQMTPYLDSFSVPNSIGHFINGDSYSGYNNQPVKRVKYYYFVDNDEQKGRKTGATSGNPYLPDYEWELWMEHVNIEYRRKQFESIYFLPYVPGLSSKSIQNSDGTTSYTYNCKTSEMIIELPSSFKGKNIAVQIVPYVDKGVYDNVSDKVLEYEYQKLTIPRCYEGARYTGFFSYIYENTMPYYSFPYESSKPSPYFTIYGINENVPDSIREVKKYTFSFPEVSDYDYSYEINNENATIKITAWAVGRIKNEYNTTSPLYYSDFVNMNEFLRFRVMATC